MAEPQFDPAGMLQIDLGRGVVQLRGASPRLVVPSEVLVGLCKEAGPDALVDFGRRWGTELGARVAERLGIEASSSSVEAWLAHLGGEWALAGLGSLAFERWGKVLVVCVEDSPLGPEGDPLGEAVIAGALQRSASRDLGVVGLGRSDSTARFAVLAPAAADTVRRWFADGVSWGDAVMRLHAGQGAQ